MKKVLLLACLLNSAWKVPVSADEFDDSLLYYSIPNAQPGPHYDLADLGTCNTTYLMDWCTDHLGCVSFTNEGLVQSNLPPRRTWQRVPLPNFLTIIKTSAKVPPEYLEDGYEVYQNYDFSEFSYGHMEDSTVDALKEYCTAQPKCVAFTTQGWVKDEIPLQSHWTYSNSMPQAVYIKGVYSAARVSQNQGLHSPNADIVSIPK